MKNEIYIPQSGDGLYEELLKVFDDKDRLDVGLDEAKQALIEYNLLEEESNELDPLGNRMKIINVVNTIFNKEFSIPLMWVLLRIQPDRNRAMKSNAVRLAQEMDNDIFDKMPNYSPFTLYWGDCRTAVKDWEEHKTKLKVKAKEAPPLLAVDSELQPTSLKEQVGVIVDSMLSLQSHVEELEKELKMKDGKIEEYKMKIEELENAIKDLSNEKVALEEQLESSTLAKLDIEHAVVTIDSEQETTIKELSERDKSIREALIRVMEARDKDGNSLFLHKAHWDSIYMILKEKGLYPGTQKGFGDYLGSLGIPNLNVGLPGKDMMRSSANGKVFASWKPITAPEKKLYRVAELFKEELEKLLPE